MTEQQTISWIFLATALASQTGPADFNSISTIADGINHAVPTQKELQMSLTWLTNRGLVAKIGSKYSLTAKGKSDYNQVSGKSTAFSTIWKKLEGSLKKYNE